MTDFTNGEVAIITGASSGIGAQAAVKFCELGVDKLCLTGRDLEALRETQRLCIERSNEKLKEEDLLIVTGAFSK